MKKNLVLIPALLTLAALSTVANAGQEKKLTQKQVPKEVLEAFHKAFPQATNIKYESEGRKEKTVYEIDFNEQGLAREASYAANGSVLETEEEIKLEELPAAVTDAIMKAHPHATVAEAEKVLKPNGTISGYEVEIKDGGKELEIKLDTTGKILSTDREKD